ncbi:MAG: peptide chain release factor N(5)-glutamine methyltransferase [Flavobacteriales bacterium]
MKIPDNRLSSIRQFFFNQLEKNYTSGELGALFDALTWHYLKLNRAKMIMEPDFRCSESEMLHFTRAIKRLAKQEPIQYITGSVEFAGMNLKVNPSVLIPRPESEELCQIILAQHLEEQVHALDICTGSGCIALALKKARPKWQVEGIDLSGDALNVAKENASIHQLQVKFSSADVLALDTFHWGENVFDLMVSNPPYVRRSEAADMRPEVLNHEPHLALFVDDDDALIFYKKIIELACYSLKHGGSIYFELNEFKAEETLQLFKQYHQFKAELIRDFAGKWRFLSAIKD